MKIFSGERKVIIRKCDSYNHDAIQKIIKEGIEELEQKPAGNILIKPNIIWKHRQFS